MKTKYKTIEDVNNGRPLGSKLRAVEFLHKLNGRGKNTRYVKCVCEACGNVDKEVLVGQITSNYISCGCVNLDRWRKMVTKYYPVIPKLLVCHKAMIARCYSPNNINYKKYGAVGVTVCEEWRADYMNFLNWAISNGYEDGLCLDKDIKGNGLVYSPETCCWVSNQVNQNYKSNSVRFDYAGQMLTLSQIGEIVGIPSRRIYQRMQIPDTTLEQAIFLIKNKINRRYAK